MPIETAFLIVLGIGTIISIFIFMLHSIHYWKNKAINLELKSYEYQHHIHLLESRLLGNMVETAKNTPLSIPESNKEALESILSRGREIRQKQSHKPKPTDSSPSIYDCSSVGGGSSGGDCGAGGC